MATKISRNIILQGIRLKANPTENQKVILSQWMGCARVIWNAKCDEIAYYSTYAPLDQTTTQFKDKVLSPWLYECPSQILRNSAVNWYQTYQKFIKGQCGKPKRKPKSDKGSIHLTRELFRFEQCADGVTRLWIGSKTNNMSYLSVKTHRQFMLPNSLYIKKERGQYFVSFCYENAKNDALFKTEQAHLDYLKGASADFLQKHRLAKYHAKIANIRKDFSHKTSRTIVDSQVKVIIFENLSTANMTRKPKAKQDDSGRFIPNKAKAKAGLNKAILDKGWHQLEIFTKYKAAQAGKAVFKIPAPYTSQECATCGHTHPDNRKDQATFICGRCGHIDNADRNASLVIKKRAILLILDTGTVLSGKGVLTLSDTGRGASCKSGKPKSKPASSVETSKKKRTAATSVAT